MERGFRQGICVNQNSFVTRLSYLLLTLSAEPSLKGLSFITEPDGDSLQVNDIGSMSPAETAGLESGFTQGIIGYYQVVA
jgi:hypothetical protein